MLEERELPQVSRGDSRTFGSGSAGTSLDAVVSSLEASRTGASGSSRTGASGSRSARKKHGIFHRTGIALPAAGLAVLLVVVVWGAVKVMDPKGAGANSLFQAIDGLGSSRQASALTQEYDTLLQMTAASKTLTVAAVPAHTNPDEVMASLSSGTAADESGGTSVATLAPPANPTAAQQTAQQLMPSFGFSVASQWSCLYSLWEQESTWNVYAENATSGAYGIPQALPGDKMASAGPDWQTDAATQIKWGLGYISQVYGTPCQAWDHEEADGFY